MRSIASFPGKMGRKLLIALAATAMYAVVLVTTASAELRRYQVTLVTGQVMTVTVDVPPATPTPGNQQGAGGGGNGGSGGSGSGGGGNKVGGGGEGTGGGDGSTKDTVEDGVAKVKGNVESAVGEAGGEVDIDKEARE